MSSWWSIRFTVSGETTRLTEFWQRLPDETTGFEGWRTAMNSSLFHYLSLLRHDERSLTIKADRNYYGGEAIEEMILRNPDLVFTDGDLWHETSLHPSAKYWEWEAQDGEFTKWETLVNWPRPADHPNIEQLQALEDQQLPDPLPFERERIEQIVAEMEAKPITHELLEQRRRFIAKLMGE